MYHGYTVYSDPNDDPESWELDYPDSDDSPPFCSNFTTKDLFQLENIKFEPSTYEEFEEYWAKKDFEEKYKPVVKKIENWYKSIRIQRAYKKYSQSKEFNEWFFSLGNPGSKLLIRSFNCLRRDILSKE